jgi:hypothetical protein
MGGTLHVGRGKAVRFKADIKGVVGDRLHLIIDGKGVGHFVREITGDGTVVLPDWIADGRPHWIRAEARDAKGQLLLIGNPIYIEKTR